MLPLKRRKRSISSIHVLCLLQRRVKFADGNVPKEGTDEDAEELTDKSSHLLSNIVKKSRINKSVGLTSLHSCYIHSIFLVMLQDFSEGQ